MPAIGKRKAAKKPTRSLVEARALPTAPFAAQVAFEMPLMLVTELNMREHWRARHGRTAKQKAATDVALQLFARWRWDQVARLRVTMTRIAPGRFDEGDNLEASAKHVRDALAAWLGVNDRDPRVTWKVEQERRGVREYGCRVEIREVHLADRAEELRAELAAIEAEEAAVAARVARGGLAGEVVDGRAVEVAAEGSEALLRALADATGGKRRVG